MAANPDKPGAIRCEVVSTDFLATPSQPGGTWFGYVTDLGYRLRQVVPSVGRARDGQAPAPVLVFVFERVDEADVTLPPQATLAAPVEAKSEPATHDTSAGDKLVPCLTASTIEALRAITQVRPLMGSEDERRVTALGNGVYGYAVPWIVMREQITLRAERGSATVMEVHKAMSGDVYLIGYLDQQTGSHLQSFDHGRPLEVTVFLQGEPEAPYPVAIPLGRIVAWRHFALPGSFADVTVT